MHIARYLLAGHPWETLETSDLFSAKNFGLKKMGTPSSKMELFFFFPNSNGDLEGRPYFQTLQMRFLSFFYRSCSFEIYML